jgi:hypothetical protein
MFDKRECKYKQSSLLLLLVKLCLTKENVNTKNHLKGIFPLSFTKVDKIVNPQRHLNYLFTSFAKVDKRGVLFLR